MIPILKAKRQVGGLIIKKWPADQPQDAANESEEHKELEAAAKELCSAIEARDHKAIAKAFHKAFKASELMPHEEAEHDESEASPHTYDAQNIKAGSER